MRLCCPVGDADGKGEVRTGRGSRTNSLPSATTTLAAKMDWSDRTWWRCAIREGLERCEA